jgi:tetratricopeptide (TPR) repeat protein
LTVLLATCAWAAGVKPKTAPPEHPKAAEIAKGDEKPATPGVEEAIPDSVKALGEPAMLPFPNGIQMAVTSSSDKAQAHVNQGLNHLHGGWEFEASRHFAAAMREDPNCLLAHWGMLMSVLSPSPETDPARVAVTARMLDLVDAGQGTAMERGYAYGMMKYIEEGPGGAAKAFRQVAEQFPNDMQAGIFAALFNRGGYDELGDATPDQESAEASMEALIKKFPQSPVPLHALLVIRAEAPDLAPSVALARKLVQMSPEYAPYFHVLGHYEWRAGNHGKAASAFGRAASFFETWMRENKATVADCPGWVKSECYRAVALVSKGEFDTAYAAARQVAGTPIPPGRTGSPGGRMLLWEAQTLPARVLLHRGLRGNANEGLHSLPDPKELVKTRKDSLAYLWIDGLRIAMEARRLMDDDKISEANDAIAALALQGEAFAQAQGTAMQNGERSLWTRGFRGMEVLASDLRGRLAMVGPADRRGAAYNWFASATDRQHPATMMLPPVLLTPMSNHLGEYYLASKKPTEAVEAYERALAAYPNDMRGLEGLMKAYESAELPAKAEEVGKRIEALKTE